MEYREISLGYDHMIHVRIKRKRDPEWRLGVSTIQLPVRSLKGADVPVAGRLAAGPHSEEYRVVDGKLYRAAGHMWNNVFQPLTYDKVKPDTDAKVSFRSILPLVSAMPWKRHERQSAEHYHLMVHTVYQDTDVAELFEDQGPEELQRISPRAHELVLIDDQVYCPSPVPMIQVHDDMVSLHLVSGLGLDTSDPEINDYCGHLSTLFSFERREEALKFARNYAAQFDHPPARLELPDAELVIEKGFENLFVVDDLIESARRNLAFGAYQLGRVATTRDSAGLAAYSELRDAVFALERPTGRTRATARRAYEAAAVFMASPEGPFTPAGESRTATAWIRKVLSISTARAAWDETFAPGPDETISADEQAALASVAGL